MNRVYEFKWNWSCPRLNGLKTVQVNRMSKYSSAPPLCHWGEWVVGLRRASFVNFCNSPSPSLTAHLIKVNLAIYLHGLIHSRKSELFLFLCRGNAVPPPAHTCQSNDASRAVIFCDDDRREIKWKMMLHIYKFNIKLPHCGSIVMDGGGGEGDSSLFLCLVLINASFNWFHAINRNSSNYTKTTKRGSKYKD